MNAGLLSYPGYESLNPYPPQTEMGAYLAAVAAASGTMTTLSEQTLNRFLYELAQKSYNRAILMIAPFCGSDINAAKVMLRNNINGALTLTPTSLTNTDYSEAIGVTGNGAGYFSTSFRPPAVGYSGGMLLALGGSMAATADTGCQDNGTNRFSFSFRSTQYFFTWCNQLTGSVAVSPTTPSAGRYYGQRRRGTDIVREVFKNGALIATDTDSDTFNPSSVTLPVFTIMAINTQSTGARSNFYTSATTLKLFMMTDGSLTAAEIADLDALVLNYFITPLGR